MPRKTDIFIELDDLIPDTWHLAKAMEALYKFTPDDTFHGMWYDTANQVFVCKDPDLLKIVADYFDTNFDTFSEIGQIKYEDLVSQYFYLDITEDRY